VPLSSLLTCSLLLLARLFIFQAALFFTNTFTIPLLLYIPILFLYKNAKAVTGAVSISISTYEEQVCALAPSLSPLLIFESFLLPAAAFSFFLSLPLAKFLVKRFWWGYICMRAAAAKWMPRSLALPPHSLALIKHRERHTCWRGAEEMSSLFLGEKANRPGSERTQSARLELAFCGDN